MISLSPTYPETSPLAMVLTISLGRPIIVPARIMLATTAVVVDPPRLITPHKGVEAVLDFCESPSVVDPGDSVE